MFNSIRNWIKPPVYPGDEDKTRVAALLNSILWFFIVAASLYGIFAPIQAELVARRAVIILPLVVILFIIKQLVNRGYIRFTGNLVVLVLWLTFTVAMLFGADYHNPAFMGVLLDVICAGLLLSWRAAIGWSLVSILTNAIILRLGQQGTLPPSDPNTQLGPRRCPPDLRRGRGSPARARPWPMPSRITLPPPNFTSSP